jgi:hypothetical protein
MPYTSGNTTSELLRKYIIVCFENPVLCTGSQKETLALSCFLCLTAFGRQNKATRFTGGSLLFTVDNTFIPILK